MREDDEEEWEDKGTCDRCGEVIPYDEVYVKNGGFAIIVKTSRELFLRG
jgi:hypothetical protein